MELRSLHRWLGSGLGVLLLYLGLTGTIVQMVDLRALVAQAPATDPDMMAMRESLDGPGNYAVISAGDYTAAPLPGGADLADLAERTFAAARRAAPGSDIRWVELRMQGARLIGQVGVMPAASASPPGDGLAATVVHRFTPQDGAPLPDPAIPQEKGPPASSHLLAKRWHRMWALGDGMLWLNALAGLGLGVITLAGLALWWRLYRARWRMARPAPYWKGGGPARALHRSLAPLAALPLLVVAVSGTLLSIDSFSLQIYRLLHPDQLVFGAVPRGMVADSSRPLSSTETGAMARQTLAAHHAETPGQAIRVLRLRVFAGMRQGVIVTGTPVARQRVYNADTGLPVSMSEPGYPDTVFPTGWEWHERLKRIHRGDIFGTPGRWLGLAAGLALVWFAASGLWMYGQMWARRRRGGRGGVFWR